MQHAISKKLISGFLLVITLLFIFSALDINAAGKVSAEEPNLKPVELKLSDDLHDVSQQASKKQVPVLLMFSMNHCPYCIEVEEDFLKPMLRNSEYHEKVVIRKVRLDGSQLMHDFKGKLREPGEFSDHYNVSMVPTVIVVDSEGKPMAEPIIGLANPHYYGHELDKAIDSSLAQLRRVAIK